MRTTYSLTKALVDLIVKMAGFETIYNLSAVIIGFVIFLGVALLLRHRKRLPPGPRGLPLLGFLPKLALMNEGDTRRWLSRLALTHEVFSLNVGGQLVVVLTQYTTMRSAFVNQQAIAKPPSALIEGILSDPNASGKFGLTLSSCRTHNF